MFVYISRNLRFATCITRVRCRYEFSAGMTPGVEFYSLIFGEEVRLERGFINLAVLAGYKFQSRNMTVMSVQGTLLNKNVSTGDDCWGVRWQQVPDWLKCYALGDIQFGFVTYNVLAGLLLRDVFPDPDVLCSFL